MAAVQYQDLVGVAIDAGRFSTFAAALQTAGLDGLLQGPGPFTVFAPTDAAFARMPASLRAELLTPAHRDRLTALLRALIVPGTVLAAEMATLGTLTTLHGSTLSIATSPSGLSVGAANVITADLEASNGVIHVIDTVLLPEF